MVDVVLARKSRDQFTFVLKYSSLQIVGHSGVEGSKFAWHKVDIERPHRHLAQYNEMLSQHRATPFRTVQVRLGDSSALLTTLTKIRGFFASLRSLRMTGL